MKCDEPQWVKPTYGRPALLMSGKTEYDLYAKVLIQRGYAESYVGYGKPPLDTVVNGFLFHQWITYLDDRFRFKTSEIALEGEDGMLCTVNAGRIVIQSVDMFGDRIGFIKLKADLVDEDGNDVPGIVFLRDDAAAVLVVLTCEEKEYTVLVHQPRAATGKFDFCEIPAGMLDGSGDFIGTAAKELKEETGIVISRDELVELGDFYASPGACSEQIGISYVERVVDRAFLDDLQGKCTGAADEGERITLRVVPLDELPRYAGKDMKSMLAYAMYWEKRVEEVAIAVLSALRKIGKGSEGELKNA